MENHVPRKTHRNGPLVDDFPFNYLTTATAPSPIAVVGRWTAMVQRPSLRHSLLRRALENHKKTGTAGNHLFRRVFSRECYYPGTFTIFLCAVKKGPESIIEGIENSFIIAGMFGSLSLSVWREFQSVKEDGKFLLCVYN